MRGVVAAAEDTTRNTWVGSQSDAGTNQYFGSGARDSRRSSRTRPRPALAAEHRHNVVGDLGTCRGRVTGKRVEEARHLVDCELWIDNQRGERIARGHATAVLPSRS